jgi:large conductance mechanosensitive channel
MGMMAEFREFAVKGNAIDLAVGVVIGAAFNKIVDSIVNDILNPIIGLAMGGINLTNKYAVLAGDVPAGTALEEAKKIAGVATLNYGALINNIIQFLIVAFVLFMIVKGVNKSRVNTVVGAPPKPA